MSETTSTQSLQPDSSVALQRTRHAERREKTRREMKEGCRERRRAVDSRVRRRVSL